MLGFLEYFLNEHDFEVGQSVTLKVGDKAGKVVKIDNYGTADEMYHVEIDGKVFKYKPDALKESTHAVVRTGGSIGENKPKSKNDYHGKDHKGPVHSKEDAEAKAKRLNKLLSPGEKSHYKIKYHAIAVKNGKYSKD